MECKYCKGLCIKKGKYKLVQKYRCKECKRYQRYVYSYRNYDAVIEEQVTIMNNKGVGISSIGRILKIPKTTVMRKVLNASLRIIQPIIIEQGQEYEVDELHTYVGKNRFSCYTYIIYAINRITKKIVDFVTGARTKENVQRLINKLLYLSPKKIYTDKLNVFRSLIPQHIHRTYKYRTNSIERKNLTLRTHLKRLSRKTICYSKSALMLEASVRLYMWNRP